MEAKMAQVIHHHKFYIEEIANVFWIVAIIGGVAALATFVVFGLYSGSHEQTAVSLYGIPPITPMIPLM
jgi:hypothetical protein